MTAFAAHLPNLQPWPMVNDGLCGSGPARPTRIASYSVSVRRVAALLPRFFQTAPHDGRPCASLALCLTGPGQRTFTSKLSNMLGTPGAVDAKNAPTAPWETGRPVFHSYHRLCLPSVVTGRVSPMFPVNFVTYVPGCTLRASHVSSTNDASACAEPTTSLACLAWTLYRYVPPP